MTTPNMSLRRRYIESYNSNKIGVHLSRTVASGKMSLMQQAERSEASKGLKTIKSLLCTLSSHVLCELAEVLWVLESQSSLCDWSYTVKTL